MNKKTVIKVDVDATLVNEFEDLKKIKPDANFSDVINQALEAYLYKYRDPHVKRIRAKKAVIKDGEKETPCWCLYHKIINGQPYCVVLTKDFLMSVPRSEVKIYRHGS